MPPPAAPRFASDETESVPFESVTPPPNVFDPDRTSVPAPSLTRPKPAPDTVPLSVVVTPVSVKNVPLALSVTLRDELNEPVVSSVPPANVIPPPAPPRFPSLDTESTPCEIVVPLSYVLLPDSVSTPSPVLLRVPPAEAMFPVSAMLWPLVSILKAWLAVVANRAE